MRSIGCFVDGSWRRGGGCEFLSVDPASEEPIAAIGSASTDDIEDAVRTARHAFQRDWGRLGPEVRRSFLYAVADELEERSEELAQLESADTGLPLSQTRDGHVPRAIACFRHFADVAANAGGEWFALENAYATLVQRTPLGVVAIIAPWNAPLAVAAMNVAAALAAGNCVLLKPSERTPLTAAVLGEIATAIELPPGVLSVLQGDGAVGTALVTHSGVNGVCFVGGVNNGRSVLKAAAGTIKRVLLELGGRSPTIVFGDANLDSAVDGALLSAFSGNGEVCTAGARILVERPLYDEFAEAFAARAAKIQVGPPLEASTEVGPLIDERHRGHVARLVNDARGLGARQLCGGAPPPALDRGFYYSPTVLDGVGPGMAIHAEEVFGPVAALMPFEGEQEALALAEAVEFGLSATIWVGDQGRGMRIAQHLNCGGVAINAPFIRDIRAPFGGVGSSGLGRVGGRWSLEAYSEPKTICLPISPYALPRYGVAPPG